jgi:uncharacterized protein (TIGR03435 family)
MAMLFRSAVSNGFRGGHAIPADNPTSIYTALQEQLGLKLDSQKGPVDVLVIDRAEKPTDN